MNYVFLILGALLVFYFLFRKNDKTINSKLASNNYPLLLIQHVEYYKALNKDKKIVFERLINEFLNDTSIEGVGLEITDLDKVLIAASAVIPVFGFPGWRYKNLTNVLLYPDTFNEEFQFEGGERRILGMVGTGYMNGQMLLSRSALIKGFSQNNGKENTAIHEFVHLLDKTDGATDGIPEILMRHQYAVVWLKMIHQEMHRIEIGKSDINPYALTNEAEFFAVVSEYFFEKPDQFNVHHPELYSVMSKLFLQDPASKL